MNRLFGLYLGYSVVEIDGVIKIGTGPGYLKKTPHFYTSEQAFDWLKSQIATNNLKPNMIKQIVDDRMRRQKIRVRIFSVAMLIVSLSALLSLWK